MRHFHSFALLQNTFAWLRRLGYMGMLLSCLRSSSLAMSRDQMCYALCSGIIFCTAPSTLRSGIDGPSPRRELSWPFAHIAARCGRALVHLAYPCYCLRRARVAPAFSGPALPLDRPGWCAHIPPCAQQARRPCRGARCARGCVVGSLCRSSVGIPDTFGTIGDSYMHTFINACIDVFCVDSQHRAKSICVWRCPVMYVLMLAWTRCLLIHISVVVWANICPPACARCCVYACICVHEINSIGPHVRMPICVLCSCGQIRIDSSSYIFNC